MNLTKKIKADCDVIRNPDGKTYCLFLENDVVLTFANVIRWRIRLSYSKGIDQLIWKKKKLMNLFLLLQKILNLKHIKWN